MMQSELLPRNRLQFWVCKAARKGDSYNCQIWVLGMCHLRLGPLPIPASTFHHTSPPFTSPLTSLATSHDNLVTILNLHNNLQSRGWGISQFRQWGIHPTSLTSYAIHGESLLAQVWLSVTLWTILSLMDHFPFPFVYLSFTLFIDP